MHKQIHFITGLPRSGIGLLTTILDQNPEIRGEPVSSLCDIFAKVHAAWMDVPQNQIIPGGNIRTKANVLRSVLQGYHDDVTKPIIADANLDWSHYLSLIEQVLQTPVKVIVCVRNPAEILASLERLRQKNPLGFNSIDIKVNKVNSLESRCYHYSQPKGILGRSHVAIRDAVTMGHLDKMLFVDYNRFCNSPRSNMKRVYEFLGMPAFDHDFEDIRSRVSCNDYCLSLPNITAIKPQLDRTVINPVQYIGLDLYDQYNKQIFWNAWI